MASRARSKGWTRRSRKLLRQSHKLKNKRILLIHHNPDNYEWLAPYQMGLHLSQKGYDVSLLVPSDSRSLSWQTKQVCDRFKVYLSPTLLPGRFRKGLDPLDLITKIRIIRRNEFDVIFLFDTRPTVVLPGVYAKLSKKIPLIIYWTDWFGRNGIISQRSGRVYRFLFEGIETFFEEYFRRFADSYAVISPTLEKRLRGLGYKKRVVFLPLGCDLPTTARDPEALRRRLNLPEDAFVVGCVGSLLPSDAELAFKSIDILRKSIDVKLLLIGQNIYRTRTQIPPDAIETGTVSKETLYDYVSACDAMLMPLRKTVANDGRWPSKLNDYLCMGKPLIATDICVVNELLKRSKFAEIADDNPTDFAEKVRLLLMNKEALARDGANAIQVVSDVLSWSSVVDTVESLVEHTEASVRPKKV
jgi:glycosyltransferase involved in cell wall biosynthesis